MRSYRLQRAGRVVLGVVATMLLAGAPRAQTPPALVGILEGSATLVRQAVRHALPEGATLADGDIVETAPGTFAQLEFADGTLLGVGESTRLLLKPKLTNLKTASPPRLYLLEGWLKLVPPPGKPDASFDLLTPGFELDTTAATIVIRQGAKDYVLFTEAGAAQLLPRGGPAGAVPLKPGDYAALVPPAERPTVANRIPQDFVQQMPRSFRDRLPARAELYAKRPVAPKSQGPIAYEEVGVWMKSEPAVRLDLSRQWRPRAKDKAFRAALAANLAQHMEWERVLYPERFLPKKPPPPAAPASVPWSAPASAPANATN